MTKEQELLLEEAKRRYPVGTHFHSLGGVRNKVIEHSKFYFKCANTVIRFDSNGMVYNNGEWAEIISKPNLNNYYFY